MGGAIATTLGWRWIFILSIVVALVALLLIRATPESRSPDACRHKLDISGFGEFCPYAGAVQSVYQQRTQLGLEQQFIASCTVWSRDCTDVLYRYRAAEGDAALIDFALFKTGPIAPRYSQISCSTAALAP